MTKTAEPMRVTLAALMEQEDMAEVAEILRRTGDMEVPARPTSKPPTPEEIEDLLRRKVRAWQGRGVDRDCAAAVLRKRVHRTEALDTVRAWSRAPAIWLRMEGGRGVGKTWAASHWLLHGPSTDARLITGAEVGRWSEWDVRWQELDTIPRLVVDDPDVPDGRPALWYRVLEARHRARLDTIVTTNARDTEAWWAWWEGYRERLQSRFREVGMAMQFGGEDMRQGQQPKETSR